MTDRIHVLHLIGSTGLYGAERWVLAQMRGIDPERVQVTLMNLVDRPDDSSEVVAAARERGLQALDFYTGGKFNLFTAFRLARWAKEHEVDIFHGHGFKSDLMGLLAAKIGGFKVITTPHGWSQEEDTKLKLYESIDRRLFQFMDRVCPLSQDLLDGIKDQLSPKKLRLILNGVDIDEVRAAASSREKASDEYIIGYIGQLIDRKDLKTLLSSVEFLVESGARVKLQIFGDGPKRTELQTQAEELGLKGRVEFFGFRPDAASFLKTFDVFVLPSLMEGIPRCIMEAMAAGVPVLISDIPGNRDLVTHGETGLLFQPGNSLELADQIRHLMANPAEACRMAALASSRVDAKYSSRRMAEEYTEIYREILQGPIRRPSGVFP